MKVILSLVTIMFVFTSVSFAQYVQPYFIPQGNAYQAPAVPTYVPPQPMQFPTTYVPPQPKPYAPEVEQVHCAQTASGYTCFGN